MLLLTAMRRAAARAALGALAATIAVDAAPTKARRSRPQHFRNGCAALLRASSEAAYRPSFPVTLYYLARHSARSDWRYGLGEIGRAVVPMATVQRQSLLLAAVPIAALTWRTRKRRSS